MENSHFVYASPIDADIFVDYHCNTAKSTILAGGERI